MTSARSASGVPGGPPDGSADRLQAGQRSGIEHGIVVVLLAAALRAVIAVGASLLLASGFALLLWAVTPDSGPSAAPLLRGSVATVAAANFLPVSIGGIAITIRPLLLTAIVVVLLAGAAARGRNTPTGRIQELAAVVVAAMVYCVLVDMAASIFGPVGSVTPTVAPFGLALAALAAGTFVHGSSWRRWWHRVAPSWARAALLSAAVATCVMVAGGAIALASGLVLSFSDATAVDRLAAPGVGGGFGLGLLGIAFLPNAVVAGIGYLSGAGFAFGAGNYSVLGSHPVDLPAIPLLAAAPDNLDLSHAGLALLVFPLAAAVVIGVIATRGVGTRWLRLAAAATGSAVTGVIMSGLAAAAQGGIAGGRWATSGVPVLLVGGLTAAGLAAVSATWAGVAGWGVVPWRASTDTEGSDAAASAAAASAAASSAASSAAATRSSSTEPFTVHLGRFRAPPPADGAVDAEPVDAEPVNAEPIDAEPVDAEPVNAGPIDAEPVDAVTVNAEPVDAVTVNAEPVNAEPVNAEPVDAVTVNAEPVETDEVDAAEIDEWAEHGARDVAEAFLVPDDGIPEEEIRGPACSGDGRDAEDDGSGNPIRAAG